MREIEKQMVNALFEGRAWRKKNTEVAPTEFGSVIVRLNGNAIAALARTNTGAPMLSVALSGWNTRTTRSRLNAILFRFLNRSDVDKAVETPDGRQFIRYAFAQTAYKPVIRAWTDWGKAQVEFEIDENDVLSHHDIMELLRELFAEKGL